MEVEDVHLADGCLDYEDRQKMDGSRPPTALTMKNISILARMNIGQSHGVIISKLLPFYAFTKLMHIINKTSILCTTILYSQQCIADLENIAIILKPGRQLLGAYACGISGYGLIITSHDTNVKEVKGHE